MAFWSKRKTGPPRAEDVIKRAIIFKHLIVKGLATPHPGTLAEDMKRWSEEERNDFIRKMQSLYANQAAHLRKSGLWDEMERQERNFMQAGPAEVGMQALVNVCWLAESAACLVWALGYISELPPYDQQANPDLMNELPQEAAEVLIKNATLRPADSIMKQRELAELWHWRSRTRRLQESGRRPHDLPGGNTISQVIQIASAKAAADGAFPAPIGDDFPALMKPYRDLTHEEFLGVKSIALERHRAFNWLCGFAPGNKWSKTPTDT